MTDKPKLPERLKRIDHTGDYVGFWFDVRMNAPFGLLIDLMDQRDQKNAELEAAKNALDKGHVPKKVDVPGATKVMYEILELLIAGWNYVDYRGQDVPVSIEGFKMLPADLLRQTLALAEVGVIEGSTPLANSGNL